MRVKPLFDRVLAKVILDNTKTLSGIQIIEKQEVVKAEVIEVGQDVQSSNLLQIGDVIYFEDFVCANIKINCQDFVLIKITDILAKEVDKHANT